MNFLIFSLILLCVLVLALLFLLCIKFRGNPKAKWIFSIIGGVYALIPFIFYVFFEPGGDYPTVFLLPFWPQILTISIAYIPFALLGKLLSLSYKSDNLLQIAGGVLNLIIWIGIGYLAGSSFKKANSPSQRGASLVFWIILGILILAAGIYMLGNGIW